MRGRIGMAMAVAALCVAVSPRIAHSYQLCAFMTSNYDVTVHVGQAWWNRPPTGAAYESCVQSNADGPVQVSFTGGTARYDCGITVPQGNQEPVKLVIERINPGISGVQPVLTCQRKTW